MYTVATRKYNSSYLHVLEIKKPIDVQFTKLGVSAGGFLESWRPSIHLERWKKLDINVKKRIAATCYRSNTRASPSNMYQIWASKKYQSSFLEPLWTWPVAWQSYPLNRRSSHFSESFGGSTFRDPPTGSLLIDSRFNQVVNQQWTSLTHFQFFSLKVLLMLVKFNDSKIWNNFYCSIIRKTMWHAFGI